MRDRAELAEFLIGTHMVSSIDAEDLADALIADAWIVGMLPKRPWRSTSHDYSGRSNICHRCGTTRAKGVTIDCEWEQ